MIRTICLTLGFCFLLVQDCLSASQKVLEFPYPSKLAIDFQANNFFCKAIVGSRLEAAPKKVGNVKKGVRGQLFKGTDRLAIEIDGDDLHLLTRASFDAGQPRDDSPFTIIQHSNNQIVAYDIDDSITGKVIHIFSLNTKTGIAVWTKQRSNDILTQNPDVQSYCLRCEIR